LEEQGWRISMDEKYTDKTPMPFGKYKNIALGDVPADYLLWCVDQPDIKHRYPALYAYIDGGRGWLEKEKNNRR
jgi:hypothetical protein